MPDPHDSSEPPARSLDAEEHHAAADGAVDDDLGGDAAEDPEIRAEQRRNKLVASALIHLERGDIHGLRGILEKAPDLLDGKFQSFVDRIESGESVIAGLGVPPDVVPPVPVRPRFANNIYALMVAPSPGSRRMIVTFGGNTRQFVIPLALLSVTDAHIVMIQDRMRCFALTGVSRLGATYEECCANLRRIAAELGADEIYCLGVSSGGYAALKYGLDLKARGVLGFSAPTTLNIADDPGATMAKYPALTALYRVSPQLGQDMARLYRETSPHPNTVIVFSRKHPRDTWLAERMTGIGGIEVIETAEDAGHKTYQWFCAHGLMPASLARLLRATPVVG